MIVKFDDQGNITGIRKIGSKKLELSTVDANNNMLYVENDLVEYIDCYFVSNNEVILRDNWEEVKLRVEAELAGSFVSDNGVVVPSEVTPVQARLALLNAGIYEDALTSLESLTGSEKNRAMIEWEYASTIKRDNYFISVIGSQLNLSDAEIDNLFIAASKL